MCAYGSTGEGKKEWGIRPEQPKKTKNSQNKKKAHARIKKKNRKDKEQILGHKETRKTKWK